VLLLEVAARLWPEALLLPPFLQTVVFKQLSGYAMLALILAPHPHRRLLPAGSNGVAVHLYLVIAPIPR
jgi:hypothetical protein